MPRFDSRYRRRVLDEWKSSQDEAATRFLAALFEQRPEEQRPEEQRPEERHRRPLPWLDRLKAGLAAAFGPLRTTAGQ